MKFGKQLQSTLVKEWAAHYVDYKSMKQLIKDSKGEQPAVRLQKFLGLIASQLEQVNSFFVAMETQLCAQWQGTNMSLVAELASDPAGAEWLRGCLLRLEVGAMGDTRGKATVPASTSTGVPRQVALLELEPEPESEPEHEPSLELSRFRAVHDDAQRLHQYVAINFIGFVKGMKKFEKKTELSVAHLFMPRLQRAKFFNSPKLASLLNDLENNAKLILCRLGFIRAPANCEIPEQDLQRCNLCAEQSAPSVALPCTHGLCWPCAASAAAVASSDGEWACPVCMRPQLLNPEVYRISSFGQLVRRSHGSGSLKDLEQLSISDRVALTPPEPQAAAELDADSLLDKDASPAAENDQDTGMCENGVRGSVISVMKEQSYYEELVSLAKHPSKPRPLLQFYHSRLNDAVGGASPDYERERLEYKLPDALACSRKLAVRFNVPSAPELKRRTNLEAFKWRRVLFEDEWIMIPSLDEHEAAEVINASAATNASAQDTIAAGGDTVEVAIENSPRKQLIARNQLSPLLRLPPFSLLQPPLDKATAEPGRCLHAFLWRVLEVGGLSLAVPHLEAPEAEAISAQLQDRLRDNAQDTRGFFRGFKSASEIKDLSEISFGKHLSKGASGTVTQATWQGMSVAVKRFYYSAGESGTSGPNEAETRAAFENELFLMRQLQHANLVRFFGAHSRPPDLCIIMELMRGSLTDLLYGKYSRDAAKFLTPSRQLGIARGICCGMDFLHAHSVCHRDLKSANVLFDRQLKVKLCDFAFSKFRRIQSEAEGETAEAKFVSSVGTPAWMAPEVLRGEECVAAVTGMHACRYTLKADVYACGIILWELQSKRRPFADLNSFQIINQVGMEGKRLEMPTDCPPVWSALANRCWDSQPHLRPTFAQLEEEFKNAEEEARRQQ